MKKLKLGLIGCGAMMGNHIAGVNYIDNAEIVAVCDLVEQRAVDVAKVLNNGPKVFTNYRDMVDDVDAVLICLPHDLHFECGMFFALNNKHLLVEKPMCNSEEECEWLIRTCDEHNVKLMCAYPVPFWNGIVELKKLVDSGEYGEIIQMSVWTEQLTGSDSKNVYLSDRVWGRTARLGGGQLFSHGCHYIDLLLRFLGEPVSGAHFGTRNGTPWMLKEGTSAVTIKFANGAIGYHGATWGARGTRLCYDFQIQTEKGMLEYEHRSGEVRVYNGSGEHQPGGTKENQSYNIVWKRGSDTSKETQHEIKHFADCVLNDKKPLTDGRSALQSLRVIWKLYNAEENGTLADLRGLGLPEA